MALYAIGDLHLSLTANKSMEVFGPAWENYTARIGASLGQLTADDVLILAGDTSWASPWRRRRRTSASWTSSPVRNIW